MHALQPGLVVLLRQTMFLHNASLLSRLSSCFALMYEQQPVLPPAAAERAGELGAPCAVYYHISAKGAVRTYVRSASRFLQLIYLLFQGSTSFVPFTTSVCRWYLTIRIPLLMRGCRFYASVSSPEHAEKCVGSVQVFHTDLSTAPGSLGPAHRPCTNAACTLRPRIPPGRYLLPMYSYQACRSLSRSLDL
ncbi:hypothetical protein GGI43DRAFT_33526 [Trichoderma evansii]